MAHFIASYIGLVSDPFSWQGILPVSRCRALHAQEEVESPAIRHDDSYPEDTLGDICQALRDGTPSQSLGVFASACRKPAARQVCSELPPAVTPLGVLAAHPQTNLQT